MSDTSATPMGRDFGGTDRFEVVRRLGAGGIGWVYEAIDRSYDARVAIKTLQRLSAAELLRFKNEFRLLQGIHHRNLVQLGELFEENGLWFFTMELVDGVDFLGHVARHRRAPLGTPAGVSTDRGILQATARYLQPPAHSGKEWDGFHEVKLRSSLCQLADGLHALHRAGRVHCDIKPENVMVSGDRVVLLDFGLVSEARPWHERHDEGGLIMGTPAYMAPEQVRGEPATVASDWYAVGAILYKALTGTLPFRERGRNMLRAKLTGALDTPTQRLRSDGLHVLVPADLEDLCMRLLEREPDHRPPGARVLARLSGNSTMTIALASLAAPTAALDSDLVGRERELAVLRAAYGRRGPDQPVVTLVHAVSGMGKTALIDAFAHELRDQMDALVLRGRCYERETVPYKAFDGVIDELVGFLAHYCGAGDVPTRGLGPVPRPVRPHGHAGDDQAMARELRILLARELDVLSRLFPVLGLMLGNLAGPARPAHDTGSDAAGSDAAGSDAAGSDAVASDAGALRRRAFGALKCVLRLLAAHWPLVLVIDDLQWGDLDSAALLAELIAPPAAPGVMILASFRDEDGDSAPVASLRQNARHALPPRNLREVVVGPLSDGDARRLAEAIWQRINGHEAGDSGARDAAAHGPLGQSLARIATREAGGNPLLIVEMMRYLATAPRRDHAPGAISLDAVIAARRGALDAAARTLLDVVAVAGRPIAQCVALRAAALSGEEIAAMAALRAAHFVRTRGPRLEDAVEIYHDRMREAVLATLDEDAVRGHHGWLAMALEDGGCDDAEHLAEHHRGAGHLERAAMYALQAAEQAEHALAFDRAARMYRLVLDLDLGITVRSDAGAVGPNVDVVDIGARLAHALASADRSREAAEAYLLAAARCSEPSESPESPASSGPGALGAPAQTASGDATRGRCTALQYRRLAAEHLLRSGDIDRGLALLGDILAASKLRIPRTRVGTLLSLLARRLAIRVRGLRYRAAAPGAIAGEQRQRVDACWSASVGLAAFDYVRAANFSARGLLMALRHGDELHIAMNLALETCYRITRGKEHFARATALARESAAIAQRLGNPRAIAFATFAAGAIALYAGGWRHARASIERAESMLREHCTGISWELTMAFMYEYSALYYLGEWSDLHGHATAAIHEALDRGDHYTIAGLAGYAVYGHLCADDVAGARRTLELGVVQWTTHGYLLQRYAQLAGHVCTELYAGDPAAAWRLLGPELGLVRSSALVRSQLLRVELGLLRARCAVAMAAAGAPHGPRLLRQAARQARAVEREGLPWGDTLALLIRAACAAGRRDQARAIALLDQAGRALERGDMSLLAAAARRQQGMLMDSQAGQQLMREADAAMSARGVARPAAVARMLAPGFAERAGQRPD
jgi:eukaryotic-like serine/threonine-protein kinase